MTFILENGTNVAVISTGKHPSDDIRIRSPFLSGVDKNIKVIRKSTIVS
jgi:hypothetical protein